MTKYLATIERKVIKTLILTYEFESQDSTETVIEEIRNGNIDCYDLPIDEDYLEEDCKDRLLTLEDKESDDDPLYDEFYN